MTNNTTAGLYLHIPFCKQACVYCNFHFSTSLQHKKRLIDAMILELELQRHYLQGLPIESIYFGGGTPSLLSADELGYIFDAINKFYPLDQLKECTIEANPDDLDKSYLHALRQLPINRLSIGVQSFHNSDLLFMNRSHDALQAEQAIKTAQDAGFNNMSIDLIYGIPGLSNTAWEQNIVKAAGFGIPHLSAYSLTVEEKTALHYGIKRKTIPGVDADQSADQFELLMKYAKQAGYLHYEISNFSLPGNNAIHNTNYWKGKHYLGIGPSAHSYNGVSRRWNVSNNSLYTTHILSNNTLLFEEEILSSTEQLNEYIMTSIRTMWGCNIEHISASWGTAIASATKKRCISFIENGWLNIEESHLILTNKGKLFADKIASELFF